MNKGLLSGLSSARKKGPTSARPTAATAGEGATYYDETLAKHIWSDGSSWRDGTGAIV